MTAAHVLLKFQLQILYTGPVVNILASFTSFIQFCSILQVENISLKNAEVKCIFAEVNPFYFSNFFAIANSLTREGCIVYIGSPLSFMFSHKELACW